MTDVLLHTAGLHRWFGGVHAVDGVDLEVARGSVHAVIGPNGSGKSTLFNLITGHTKASAGTVVFDGTDITRLAYHKVARLGLVKSYQITTVFPLLSVFENVRVAAQAASSPYVFWRPAGRIRPVVARTEQILEQVGLTDKADELAGNLAHGDERRLDLAIALVASPRLVLLDEPTAGMNPADTQATVELIGQVRANLTILIIEHKMDVIFTIADRITVLHQGAVLFEGPPTAVKSHPDVQEVYLTGSL
jgi:branched-chain amino acid transport system ATP-binding protein